MTLLIVDYFASNDRIFNEQWIGKDMEVSGRGLNLKYPPGVWPKGVRKITNNLPGQPDYGRDFNAGPSDYEPWILTTLPWLSISTYRISLFLLIITYFNIIFLSKYYFRKLLFLWSFPIILVLIPFPPIRPTDPSNLILLNIITLTLLLEHIKHELVSFCKLVLTKTRAVCFRTE
jgi:hypothetical protein